MANNQGIMHAAQSKGGVPLCRNLNAHMSTDISTFRKEEKQCKRCAAKLAKIDAKALKRALTA